MLQAEGRPAPEAPGAGFTEGHVEADGFRIRYMQAGEGAPLVYLHGGGGLQLTRAHGLLSQRFHLIAFEMPGFGHSPENTRTGSMPQLAATMGAAIAKLGLETFNLWGTSFGGGVALWLALQAPGHISALVLESPAAIRPQGAQPPPDSPEELARRLYAHPERVGVRPDFDPAVRAKTRALMGRLQGAGGDSELQERLRGVSTPTLVLFGTEDRLIPPEMGRIYKERMPNCSFVFVYDAAHEIGADRPEALVEVVVDFLERQETFIISRRDTLILP